MKFLFYSLAVLAILPLILLVGWLFIPVALTLLGVFLAVTPIFYVKNLKTIHSKVWQFMAENLKIFGIFGLSQNKAIEEKYTKKLQKVMEHDSSGGKVAACSCVKKSGDKYLSVIRIVNKNGSSYVQLEGLNKDDVIKKSFRKFREFMHHYPIVPGSQLSETEVCNNRTCPFAGGPLQQFGQYLQIAS